MAIITEGGYLGSKIVENFDENEFRKAIWELYLLEVLWRGKGNPLEADRLMKLRVRLKASVGIETVNKEEN